MCRSLLCKIVLTVTIIIVLSFCVFLGLKKQTPKTPSKISEILDEVFASPVITSNIFQNNYIEIMDGCGASFDGLCVNVRSGPGEDYKVVARLRTGIVLKVKQTIDNENRVWYKIQNDDGLKFPERINSDWYVASGDYLRFFSDIGDQQCSLDFQATSSKRIIVDLSEEILYAYDGGTLFMKEPVSTGLEFTPTPHGTFNIFRKTPSRYMQGPIPGVSDQIYDLPGVPWDLYFTRDGAVIHGAYWHNNFGEPWSHGCVNLSTENAKKLYLWVDIGTPVTIQN